MVRNPWLKRLGLSAVFFLAAAALWANGKIEVVTEPAGAEIYVEPFGRPARQDFRNYPQWGGHNKGKAIYIGRSPCTSKPLGRGRFRVIAVKEGYSRTTEGVNIENSDTYTVKLTLRKTVGLAVPPPPPGRPPRERKFPEDSPPIPPAAPPGTPRHSWFSRAPG